MLALLLPLAAAASLTPGGSPPPPARLTEADLAPALVSPAEVQGKAAYDEGRFADAARLLARSDRPEAAFLRALSLAEAKRHAEALAAAKGLEEALPDVADRVRFLRGQELLALGRRGEAALAFSSVGDGSVLGPEARLQRARALEALGDRRGALAALEPLLSAPRPDDLSRPDPGASALLLAGRLRAALSPADRDGARTAFLDCWAGHPLAPEAGDCLAAMRDLPGPAGAPPPPEEIARRAEGLVEQNHSVAAIVNLRRLLPGLPAAGPGEPFACRVRAALGRAYRRERRHRDTIETLRPVVDGCEDPALRARALYVLAGSLAISGDRDESVALYRRLAREFPGHSYADDALFAVSDMHARDGRLAEASDALAAITRDHAEGDRRDEARFRLAWLAKRAGEVDAAVAQLLAIEETERDVDAYEHARAAYWRARLVAGRGEGGNAAARAIWVDLAARYPADYYGLLARARLREASGESGDGLPPPIVAPPPEEVSYDAGTLLEDPRFRAGVLLLRMGLERQAADELAAVDPARLRGEAVLLVADLLDRAGDHRDAHHLLRTVGRDFLRRPPEGQNLRVWRIAYPPAYRDHVVRWAPLSSVPPDLLQALMREESALDRRAVSPAGAIGLTQLMLPTAQGVARRLRLPRPSRADLMDAGVNIRIGSRYLGDLLARYDGSAALALAAYNAGMGAVGRWLADRRDLDLDEFVEEIPYEETRGYVKRVLRSYAAYSLLYGKPVEEALLLDQKLPGT
jgi:soluble lytic murein transglycosylase